MKGPVTGRLTTEGFRDELELRRGYKEDIWDVRLRPPPAIAPRRRRRLMPRARPHAAVICNSMWALTDFTEENGATRLAPGSHLWEDGTDYGAELETVPAEMGRGSVLVWHGSLWHAGGANRTAERRVGIAMNYCAGFIRQQENQQLRIPREIAARFSPRLRQLVGYGIYRGLIGHIDKRDPAELLGDGDPVPMVWDRT